MVKVAAELADQGLVERVRNPDDRRSYALTRTPEGAAAARRWRRHAEDLEEALTPGFSLARARGAAPAPARDPGDGELAPDTPEPLLESLGFLITRVHLRMHRAFSEALAPLRHRAAPHSGSLTTLATLGPVPQAEVGRRLGHQRRRASSRWSTTSRRAGWSSGAGSSGTAAPRCCTSGPAADRGRCARGDGPREADAGHAAAAPSACAEIKRLVLLLQRFVTGE